MLGVSISMGEQEVHWRTFLESLVKRGLRGVELIISDDHAGLKAARQAVFGGIALAALPISSSAERASLRARKEMQTEVAEDIRTIFNAPDRSTAEEYLKEAVKNTKNRLPIWPIGWSRTCPKA